MDGRLFLFTAKSLRDSGADEAAFRSAISRAYYACHLGIRKMVFENCDKSKSAKEFRSERGISHDKLLRYLQGSADKDVQKIGVDLAGLKGRREIADYDMSKIIAREEADDAIEEAENILKSCDPTEIGKAVDEWINRAYFRSIS